MSYYIGMHGYQYTYRKVTLALAQAQASNVTSYMPASLPVKHEPKHKRAAEERRRAILGPRASRW